MKQALLWGAPLTLAVLAGALLRGRLAGPLAWAAAALALFAVLLLAVAEE
jgi:hypothetical protein